MEKKENNANFLKNIRLRAIFFVCILVISGSFYFVSESKAATLHLGPSNGTFTVGSTFTVSVFLNTEADTVNTISTSVTFPPDKLQVVSPSAGSSIISTWVTFPSFDNQNGRINLQGGIPGGIKVNNGLITTITFRVKAVGTAVVKFTDNSKVLLHDGQGTDVLRQTTNGLFQLVLPPPAGPIVTSPTHSVQSQWYANPSAVLEWAAEQTVDGYSYILNSEPVDFPDDISEGIKTSVNYKSLPDGDRYFHIKALKDNGWGGTTHFAVKIDTTPPAKFPIEVIPDARTTRRQPIIQFSTTDALSGIDHYELKLIPLKIDRSEQAKVSFQNQPLFIDVVSPYLIPSELNLGTYDVIIRAYDKAQNYQEVTQRLSIVTALFKIVQNEGIQIRNTLFIPWKWGWSLLLLLIVLLLYISWRMRRWHKRIVEQQANRELPQKVRSQLEELQSYRAKYGKIAIIVLLCVGVFMGGRDTFAQPVDLAPPVITTISQNITNEEIFYVGGKTDIANAQVIIYLQNLTSGETLSQIAVSDKRGEWFYRHTGFLTSGNYLLWVQSKIGEQISPPSPQTQLGVRTTAIQFGASRVSFEALYLGGVLASVAIIIALLIHIMFHSYYGKKRHQQLMKEIQEAEESVRRGFAVLRRDIEAELQTIHKMKLSKELSEEEKIREAQLLNDLDLVEKNIGKEIWDVERVEAMQ